MQIAALCNSNRTIAPLSGVERKNDGVWNVCSKKSRLAHPSSVDSAISGKAELLLGPILNGNGGIGDVWTVSKHGYVKERVARIAQVRGYRRDTFLLKNGDRHGM